MNAAVPFMVTPGSEQVRATIERDGQMDLLKEINATVWRMPAAHALGSGAALRRWSVWQTPLSRRTTATFPCATMVRPRP